MKTSTIYILFALIISFNAHTQSLYDINNITQLELTFFIPDWDDSMTYYKTHGLTEQRVLANCVINGVQFDSVGVKYKGNSTFDPSSAKKPLNIELDYVINQDYNGYTKLKMSNGKNEPSFVREVVAYEIARKYMDAPLCNYVQVYVNGNYHGLYESAEAINKRFVEAKYYSNKNNPLFKCDPKNMGAPPVPGCLNSFNCSFLYLGTDSMCYDNPYELKSNYGLEALRMLTYEIQNNPSTIENYLDIDRLIWLMAYNNVMVNLDSYLGQPRHNFYVYQDNHQRWNFILLDVNEAFGGFRNLFDGPQSQANNTQLQQLEPFEKWNNNHYPLLNMIFDNPTYQKMYMAHFKTIFEENILNDDYFARCQYFQSLIDNANQTDPNAFYPYADFIANLTTTIPNGNKIGIKELMDGRKSFLSTHPEMIKVAPQISNIVSPSYANPNSTITITAQITTNPINVYLGYRHSVADPFTKITMYDDGAHNDGAANDGVFGVDIITSTTTIQYYIYAENNDAGIFSPVRAEHEFYSIPVAGDVVINEVSAINNTIATDDNGQYEDWIELYNNSNSTIDLTGYFLTDDITNLTKWQFPNATTINANDFLIIWADNDLNQTGLHASFKISSSGESVFLVDPSQNIVDEIVLNTQSPDITFGRYPNGTGNFVLLYPTFNANNTTPVGVTEIEANDLFDFNIYPNPAQNQINLSTNISEKTVFQIYDLTGKLILSDSFSYSTTIDIEELNAGIYIVLINGVSKKLVVN